MASTNKILRALLNKHEFVKLYDLKIEQEYITYILLNLLKHLVFPYLMEKSSLLF